MSTFMEDFYKMLWEHTGEAFVQVGVAGGKAYNLLPEGWRCPVCGRGLAPDVKECFHGLETHEEYMERLFSTPSPEA